MAPSALARASGPVEVAVGVRPGRVRPRPARRLLLPQLVVVVRVRVLMFPRYEI